MQKYDNLAAHDFDNDAFSLTSNEELNLYPSLDMFPLLLLRGRRGQVRAT